MFISVLFYIALLRITMPQSPDGGPTNGC